MMAGEDASRNSWAYLAGAGVGVVYLVVLIQRFRRRAVDPDRQDPARHIALMAKWGCPALAVAAVAAICIALDQQWIAGPFIVLAAIVDVVAAIVQDTRPSWRVALTVWPRQSMTASAVRTKARRCRWLASPRNTPARALASGDAASGGRTVKPESVEGRSLVIGV